MSENIGLSPLNNDSSNVHHVTNSINTLISKGIHAISKNSLNIRRININGLLTKNKLNES